MAEPNEPGRGVPFLTRRASDIRQRLCICEVVEALGGALTDPAQHTPDEMAKRHRVQCPLCGAGDAGLYCGNKRFFCDGCGLDSAGVIDVVMAAKGIAFFLAVLWLERRFPG